MLRKIDDAKGRTYANQTINSRKAQVINTKITSSAAVVVVSLLRVPKRDEADAGKLNSAKLSTAKSIAKQLNGQNKIKHDEAAEIIASTHCYVILR